MQAILDGVTTYTETNNVITIDNAGSFNASSSLLDRTYTLTFKAPLAGVSETEQTMTLDVVFVQQTLD